MFGRIVLTAVLAGLVAGVFLWGAHMVKTTPLILAAEVYENAATTSAEAPVGGPQSQGFERAANTLLADVLAGVGFAFLLTGAVALAGRPIDWRRGVAWGLGGYAAFFAAPSLGLPPELASEFAIATMVVTGLFWMVLGGLTGYFYGRFEKP